MKKEKVKKEKQGNKDTIVINKKSFKSLLIKIISILIIIVIVVPVTTNIVRNLQEGKLYNIRSEKHLEKLVKQEEPIGFPRIFTSTFLNLLLSSLFRTASFGYDTISKSTAGINEGFDLSLDAMAPTSPKSESSQSRVPSSDYSKTNVQVENIDEADVIKTDGGYVYSISENKVIITDVLDKNNPKVLSKIESDSTTFPMEILINDNKLIIISTSVDKWRYSTPSKSLIEVYDISNKETPKKLKGIILNSTYNTSRIINNKVYIFASQDLRYIDKMKEVRSYTEDFKQKEIPFNKMKYLKNLKTTELTTFVCFDLNEISKDVAISSYLIDMENVYVSYQNFYVLSTDYRHDDNEPFFKTLKYIFGFKGIFGIGDMFDYDDDWSWRDRSTRISKYQFTADGEIKFYENTKVKGKILNQYSCDEKDGNLRIALNDSKGTRIVVLDDKLNEIGDTGPVAPGEDNKSVRFTGNKAYFVTYKQVDPLYVIDLSNPRDPTIMGELKIPGFSNYLHPYDDNHIIGIGMATNEDIIRDDFGRPIGENITFNGMKMTMFDISDVRNPKEKDVVYFGDRSTDSQINKNAKALLFSKEKNLIAIPISNMGNSNWWVGPLTDEILLKNPNMPFVQEKIKEGYIVYNITVDGFKYKGIITHDDNIIKYDYTTYYKPRSPIRGLYIDNYLLTVSNSLLKINELNTLKFVSNINLVQNKLEEKEIGKTYIPENTNNVFNINDNKQQENQNSTGVIDIDSMSTLDPVIPER